MAKCYAKEDCDVTFQVCMEGGAVCVEILHELPGFRKDLTNASEVISHVASETGIEGLSQDDGQVSPSLQPCIGEELQELD